MEKQAMGMENIAGLYKALSDETRLRILKLLEHGELCVCDLTAALDMTQPNVSFHLGILREAGLIKDRKAGRWSYYELDFSDIMNRVVVLTTLERLGGSVTSDDRSRLVRFMELKQNGKACAPKAVR